MGDRGASYVLVRARSEAEPLPVERIPVGVVARLAGREYCAVCTQAREWQGGAPSSIRTGRVGNLGTSRSGGAQGEDVLEVVSGPPSENGSFYGSLERAGPGWLGRVRDGALERLGIVVFTL